MQETIRPRPINPWLYLGILVTIVALILLEWTSVDMDLANLFFDRAAGEFIGRHSYLLETILHDRVKQVVIALSWWCRHSSPASSGTPVRLAPRTGLPGAGAEPVHGVVTPLKN
jgi:membrane-associated PAP2 superfamily phosphatase